MSNLNSIAKACFLAALLTCFFTGGALAQRPGGQGGPPVGGPQAGGLPWEQLANILGLTEAQVAQIKTIQQNADTAAQPYEAQLRPLFAQAQALTEASVFNETALRNLYTQIAPLQLEIHIIQARAHTDSFNVLTAEQKAKLAELRQFMQSGGGRPGGGGRPMSGRTGERPLGN